MLDGRVKTLHPRIHGGLLGMREKSSHVEQMGKHGIEPIDMVVVNLYPFRETAAREDARFEEVVEQIDIGGPSMVRSAAKNHVSVAVVTDPRDYGWVLSELQANDCGVSPATCFILAQKAFAYTASYDAAISAYLAERVWSADGVRKTAGELPRFEVLPLEKIQDLRYGENPHQRAAVYHRVGSSRSGVTAAEVLHGKELSYNNLIDSEAAWSLALEFDKPAAAVIKHTNPSGAAQSDSLHEAYVLARDGDPVSAYGSVVALNREVDEQTAAEINSTFVEVVLAPGFSAAALQVLKKKANIRLLRTLDTRTPRVELRQVGGGYLMQDRDSYYLKEQETKVVTRRAPSGEEMAGLLFGWKVVKHVKSNAIVYCNAMRTLGIGAGQMSRVDSVKWGAQRAVLPLAGCVMASDAFFPFPDGIEAAAAVGVRAVIQPGGSVRDKEAIAAADRHDMAMVFTGIRHFRH
jgi:phosphoribosylaminoimidazolecarboxamide formyltransferase/IMP cyclohydrolase